jgi:hypothetical protein
MGIRFGLVRVKIPKKKREKSKSGNNLLFPHKFFFVEQMF